MEKRDFVTGLLYPTIIDPEYETASVIRSLANNFQDFARNIQQKPGYGEITQYADTFINENLLSIADGLSDISAGIDYLSEQVESLASLIEWEAELLHEDLSEIKHILKEISIKLSRPMEMRAQESFIKGIELKNEWARRKKTTVLSKSDLEVLYKKAHEHLRHALSFNPSQELTYFIMIAQAKLYILAKDFDAAEKKLKEGLPFAFQRKGFDYICYSKRLLARIRFTLGDDKGARNYIHEAVSLPDEYVDGWYDYAQYLAYQTPLKKEKILEILIYVMQKSPFYWYLADKEVNFARVRDIVLEAKRDVLEQTKSRLLSWYLQPLQKLIAEIEPLEYLLSHYSSIRCPRFYTNSKDLARDIQQARALVEILSRHYQSDDLFTVFKLGVNRYESLQFAGYFFPLNVLIDKLTELRDGLKATEPEFNKWQKALKESQARHIEEQKKAEADDREKELAAKIMPLQKQLNLLRICLKSLENPGIIDWISFVVEKPFFHRGMTLDEIIEAKRAKYSAKISEHEAKIAEIKKLN